MGLVGAVEASCIEIRFCGRIVEFVVPVISVGVVR